MPIRSKSIERALGLSRPKGWHPNKKRIPSDKTKIIRIAKGKGKVTWEQNRKAIALGRARITDVHLNLRFSMADMDRFKLAAKQGWSLEQMAKLALVEPKEMASICHRNGIRLCNTTGSTS